VDSKADCDIYADKFPEICTAIAEGITGEEADWQPEPGPPIPERPDFGPPEPPDLDVDSRHPTLKEGDQGEAVMRLQRSLGLKPDGDFGSITDTQVRAFQAACELKADGVVGPMTWSEVDTLNAKMATGSTGVSDDMISDIDRLVVASGLDDYTWDDRGTSPPGYISGMALCFALAESQRQTGKASFVAMAKPVGSSDTDALAWYKDEFESAGMANDTTRARIRHLFVLLIGLGMRESSGKYCEGRDMSASNTSSDTCEAGLFQSSWNFHNSSNYIDEFFQEYWADPNGFLEVFQEGVSPTANNLNCYGTGDGAAYQWLAKFCPAFAVMSTAIGLRVLRKHWGPIERKEVELVEKVDELLLKIQELVEDGGSLEIA
jgi:peptidoglycan hydrolase-like protein with peptidoglycan-binding domain